MSKIQVLSPLLVNQIAAGECIERPASIVKELVENSLDAGATHIEITIEEAGNRLIRVQDDGCGMEADDLPLALLPHATSKIKTVEDLFNIHTLGFRGEALASISSVADIRIASALPEATSGYEIEIRNQQQQPVQPVGMKPGTIIEVRNLFFNIPGRRKFLKNTATEMGHINDMVIRLALAAPKVSFRLTHNRRQIINFSQCTDYLQRIQEAFPHDDAEFTRIDRSSQNYHLVAYLALPQYYRCDSKWQFCYFNGRCIKDRVALRGLQDGYQDYLGAKNCAMAVLYMDIVPTAIDVNVHPTKAEIRHRYSQEVYQLVRSAVSEGFAGLDLSKKVTAADLLSAETPQSAAEQASVEAPPLADESGTKPVEDVNQTPLPQALSQMQTLPESSPTQASNTILYDQIHETRHGYAAPLVQVQSSKPGPIGIVRPISKPQSSPSMRQIAEQMMQAPMLSEHQAGLPYDQIPMPINPKAVFQLHNTYIVLGCPDGLCILDQHALHERVLYEQLREQVDANQVAAQNLLFPEPLTISHQDMALFQEWQHHWSKLGFGIRQAREDCLEIFQIPAILEKASPKDLVMGLFAQVHESGSIQLSKIMEKMLATMACKAAIKAGDPLNQDEIIKLLQAKRTAQNSFHCPHGRPTILKITIVELEKYFERR